MRAHSARWVGVAVAIAYIFLWASAYVPSKIAAIESPALWFLAARFLAAGLILAGVAAALGKPLPRSPRAWLEIAFLGLFANALYLGCTYTALHRLSAGVGAIIASTNPLVLALVAPKLLGEALTTRKVIGLALGFGGVVGIM
ncbi:MAG: DMT family transporter, partial [Vulcanimicrobiaceae bacterium]